MGFWFTVQIVAVLQFTGVGCSWDAMSSEQTTFRQRRLAPFNAPMSLPKKETL
jgi:hypothetical protein